jgi:hypothetical protein
MTKSEVMQRIAEAASAALNADEEFKAACERLGEVGFKRSIGVNILVFQSETMLADPRAASDADFLRSLRIAPDLELQ